MSDRLSELLRQRALLREHAAWLDREIEAAEREGGKLPELPPPPVIVSPPAVLSVSISSPVPVPRSEAIAGDPAPALEDPAADAILSKYRVDTRNVQQDVRKGCFLYFAAALSLVALVVTVLYFAISSR